MLKRCEKNPVITTDMVKPSDERFEVACVINPGVTEYNDEIILLLRIGERVKNTEEDVVSVPTAEGILSLKKDTPGYDFSDPRVVTAENVLIPTTMSHLRLARSRDGVNFEVEEKPALYPDRELEMYGIEDARITKIEDTYYIVYTAVSKLGIIPCLATTKDFVTYEKKGAIFHATNKDVLFFPEKVKDMYLALLRPMPSMCGTSDIWLAKSPDLLHWGEYEHVLSPGPYEWNGARIGASLVPIKTDRGWLAVIHSASKKDIYCMNAILLDTENPSKVIAKTKEPIMLPEADYEKHGFFNNAIFPSGAVCRDGRLFIYYGAADTNVCMVETTVDYLLGLM